MKEGLLYANAVARSKENGLLSAERLNRLFAAPDLPAALKVLSEAGWGGAEGAAGSGDYEAMIRAEEDALAAFCRSVPPGTGLELFFLGDDYHNLKCLLKAKHGDVNLNRMVMEGDIPLSRLQAAVDGEATLSPEMMGAIAALKRGTPSPRTIDATLDAAMSAEIARRAAKAGELIRTYFRMDTDTKNLEIFARTVRIGGDEAFFRANFLPGGALDLDWFTLRLPGGLDALQDSPYPKLVAVLREEGVVGYERRRENALLGYMKERRYDLFDVAPLAGYYLAKACEIRTVRMALTLIKNGVERSEMEKRKRDCYA